MVTIREVLQPSLGDWEFEKNEHLFRWSAALVQSVNAAVAESKLETVETKGLETFEYLSQNPIPFPTTDRQPQPLPSKSADDMRSEVLPSSLTTGKERAAYGVARPNEQAYFDLNQSFGLKAFWIDFDSFRGLERLAEERSAYIDGAAWLISDLSQEGLGFNLLHRELIVVLGVEPATAVLVAHLVAKLGAIQANSLIDRTKDRLSNIDQTIELKLGRIKSEYHRWADAGRTVVPDGDGLNAPLTITNVATALVALWNLEAMAIATFSFGAGVRAVIQSLQPR